MLAGKKIFKSRWLGTAITLGLVLLLPFASGCSGDDVGTGSGSFTEIDEQGIPLETEPSACFVMPEASGTTVYSNDKAVIDASNIAQGYVMICYTGTAQTKIKVIITGPDATAYTYNLNNAGKYEVFPFSGGNGEYKIGVYENISGIKYATAYSTKVSVLLENEFVPFLGPNQYVNYNKESAAVALAAKLTKNSAKELDKIEVIYNYVVNNLTYDKERAATVKSGYLPDIDDVLAKKKGICFDYAALMTAMLRSQSVPTKLVIGYTGSLYHAWISTYVKDVGWVDGVIYFDGSNWKLMDPTFASGAKSSQSIIEYIGNGTNYSAKYLY